jgi:monothiol glutaredoxin
MAHPLLSKVEKIVKSYPVVVFMKGTPDFPQCGFSKRAVMVLKAAGAPGVLGVNVFDDDDLWGAAEEFANYDLSPMVFVNGEFIGGSDIALQMYEQGELQKLLGGVQWPQPAAVDGTTFVPAERISG